MKFSTKFFAAVVLTATLFGYKVKAQSITSDKWHLDVGLEGGVPTQVLHTISSTEFGATMRLQYKLKDDLSLTLTSGYFNASVTANTNTYTTYGKTIYITSALSQGIVPVKAGVRKYLIPEFYVSAEAGVGFETQYNTDKKLLLSPGFGYASETLDIGLHYENFSGQGINYGIIGLRVAYGFGF